MPHIVETLNINRSTYYYQTIQKASAHYQPVRERVSLLKQASSTTTVNQKWTTDITCSIPFKMAGLISPAFKIYIPRMGLRATNDGGIGFKNLNQSN